MGTMPKADFFGENGIQIWVFHVERSFVQHMENTSKIDICPP